MMPLAQFLNCRHFFGVEFGEMAPKPFRKKKEDFFLYFGGSNGAVQWPKAMKIWGTKLRKKNNKIKDDK